MNRMHILAILAATAAAPAATSAVAARDRVDKSEIDRASLCGIGRPPSCGIKTAVARGMFETGLRPQFAANVRCRGIDENWAINYTYKRDREAYHGGIDMPAPFGTPIVAAASGTVVGVYSDPDSYRGIEVILRHTPQDTGIPLYIYTVYAHLEKKPTLSVGDRVRLGDVVGLTGNTGRTPERRRGRRQGGDRGGRSGGRGNLAGDGGGSGRLGGGGSQGRRPAVHFAVYYSASPKYAALPQIVIPADGYWMDPNALYRGRPPFDSNSVRALPAAEKRVPIPYMLPNHEVFPAGTKLIWPYTCTPR